MSLRERAVAAYEAAEAARLAEERFAQEAQRQQRARRLMNALEEAGIRSYQELKNAPVLDDPWEIEGLKFSVGEHSPGIGELMVLLPCPGCTQEMVRVVHSLADLGRILFEDEALCAGCDGS